MKPPLRRAAVWLRGPTTRLATGAAIVLAASGIILAVDLYLRYP